MRTVSLRVFRKVFQSLAAANRKVRTVRMVSLMNLLGLGLRGRVGEVQKGREVERCFPQ